MPWCIHMCLKTTEIWSNNQSQAPYLIKEAALLYESDSYKSLDSIIVVDAPRELCIARIKQRDNLPTEDIEARMANQDDPAAKVKKADHVVVNDGETPLIPQILSLHNLFCKKTS